MNKQDPSSSSNHSLKKLLIGFLLKALVLFIGWQVLYYAYLLPNGALNDFLSTLVVQGTDIGLRLLGFDTYYQGHYIYMDDQAVVLVNNGCNGLELFVLYMGFLICFPGSWKYKAFFIPAGVLVVFILNILRNIALVLNYRFFETTFDFNHKYTYVFIVYVVVFAMWRFWLNRYSSIAKPA